MKKLIRRFFYRDHEKISETDFYFFLFYIVAFYIVPIFFIGRALINGERSVKAIEDSLIIPVQTVMDLVIEGITYLVQVFLSFFWGAGQLFAIILLFRFLYYTISDYYRKKK